MNQAESHECLLSLAELFPQADLQEAELAVFRKALLPFQKQDVVDAIGKHRLLCKFSRPTFKDILTDLELRGRREKPVRTSRYNSMIASELARANAALDGKPEAELIVHYHRYWFFRYRKMTLWDKRTQAMREPTAIDSERIDAQRLIARAACKRDLWDAGCDDAECASLADWIDAPQPDFEGMVADLAGVMAA